MYLASPFSSCFLPIYCFNSVFFCEQIALKWFSSSVRSGDPLSASVMYRTDDARLAHHRVTLTVTDARNCTFLTVSYAHCFRHNEHVAVRLRLTLKIALETYA